MPLFWMSFCDNDKPRRQQFLGACIVEAPDKYMATPISHLFGCNPGGEIFIFQIPEKFEGKVCVEDRNKLFNKETLQEKFGSLVNQKGEKV